MQMTAPWGSRMLHERRGGGALARLLRCGLCCADAPLSDVST
jgi:hypothetical protein